MIVFLKIITIGCISLTVMGIIIMTAGFSSSSSNSYPCIFSIVYIFIVLSENVDIFSDEYSSYTLLILFLHSFQSNVLIVIVQCILHGSIYHVCQCFM